MARDATAHAVTKLIQAGRDREAALLAHNEGRSMDPLTQLDRLGPALGDIVAGITPEQLDDPTPCADSTIRGVLEHMISGATAFAAAVDAPPTRGRSNGSSPTPAVPPDN